MNKKTTFIFTCDSDAEASVLLQSIQPEVMQKIPKVSSTITQSANTVFLDIKSDDLSSLRAACNSYLRWINTALSVKSLL
jgi:tRNA threonylcarbamoyladenosine modification (KEOPS) complex  Pcc1 subunit